MDNKRALSEKQLQTIEAGYWTSSITDHEIMWLIESAKIFRESIHYLIGLYHNEPLSLIATSDAIRNDTLDEIKQRCAMDDERPEQIREMPL